MLWLCTGYIWQLSIWIAIMDNIHKIYITCILDEIFPWYNQDSMHGRYSKQHPNWIVYFVSISSCIKWWKIWRFTSLMQSWLFHRQWKMCVCQKQVSRAVKSNYIPFHGMWLLLPAVDTCFWHTSPQLSWGINAPEVSLRLGWLKHR